MINPDPRKFAFGYGRRICPVNYDTVFMGIVTMLAASAVSAPIEEPDSIRKCSHCKYKGPVNSFPIKKNLTYLKKCLECHARNQATTAKRNARDASNGEKFIALPASILRRRQKYDSNHSPTLYDIPGIHDVSVSDMPQVTTPTEEIAKGEDLSGPSAPDAQDNSSSFSSGLETEQFGGISAKCCRSSEWATIRSRFCRTSFDCSALLRNYLIPGVYGKQRALWKAFASARESARRKEYKRLRRRCLKLRVCISPGGVICFTYGIVPPQEFSPMGVQTQTDANGTLLPSTKIFFNLTPFSSQTREDSSIFNLFPFLRASLVSNHAQTFQISYTLSLRVAEIASHLYCRWPRLSLCVLRYRSQMEGSGSGIDNARALVGDGRILSRFRDGDEQNHWLIFSSNSSATTGRVTIALILLRGRKIHCEVFTFTTNRTFTWKRIIRPLLFEAAKA
ncbi:hypothetical protein EV360DRAFT_76530 [Lentinula raphanica]|nr:hypothetical protein EV360DRAFT_76530 [Lentinula raphanica]